MNEPDGRVSIEARTAGRNGSGRWDGGGRPEDRPLIWCRRRLGCRPWCNGLPSWTGGRERLLPWPASRDGREADPTACKNALKKPMQNLAARAAEPERLEAGGVNFWATLPANIDKTRAKETVRTQ